MFGKKREPKVKQPSPRVIMIDCLADAVAQLRLGENLHHRLPEFYWTDFTAQLKHLEVDINQLELVSQKLL